MAYQRGLFLLLAMLLALSFSACCDEESCTSRTFEPIDINDPPSIQSQRDTLCLIGDSLRLQAAASDPDGDEITYHLKVALHSGEDQYDGDAFLDSESGEFIFVPNASDMPYRSFTFIVKDEHGYAASTTFQVTVWPYYVDQENTAPRWGSQNAVAFSPIGQEFTPGFETLDVVELFLSGGPDPADFKVNIRSGTIAGTIIGESDVVSLPGGFFEGEVAFDFDGVVLIPNEIYVIDLTHMSGDTKRWMVSHTGRSSYPNGRQILNGEPQENNDLWFREGVRELVFGSNQ